MTKSYKIAFTFLAALALACVLVVILRDDGTGAGTQGYDLEGDAKGPDTASGANKGLKGAQPKDATEPNLGPDGGGGLQPGMRTPEGIDLSDPAVREAELTRLLSQSTVIWQDVAKIVGLMEEPIPAALRPKILNEIKFGKRNQVMFVFAVLRDESFVEDLFELLDDSTVIKGGRSAVLTALWQMPGGDRDAIARQLESRLAGDPVRDLPIIQAMAKRGGPEAGRALVEYLQGTANPRQIPQHILQSLDVTDPQTAEVIAGAIRGEQSPKVLRALITTASKAGARAMVDPLISLDRDGIPVDVRQQVLTALARIGDTPSVDYLLRKSEEPGVFGERAIQSIGVLNTSARGVADVLTKALAGASNNPRPAAFKKSLLIAIGRARAAGSLSVVAKTLDDPDEGVQQAAVQAMGSMGHRSRGYISKLSSIYSKGSELTKRRIAIALGSIGGDEAAKAMRGMLKEEGLSPSLKQTLLMGMRNVQEELKAAAGG